MINLNDMSAADFAALENEVFSVAAGGRDLPLTLVEVTGLGSGMREKGAFSLLWQGPADPALPQATYRMSQAAIGEQDIFLVPVARTGKGFQYEAVFT